MRYVTPTLLVLCSPCLCAEAEGNIPPAPAPSIGVRVRATPEPMSVLEALKLRTLGLWSLSVCNETAATRTLARERLVLALPSIRIVGNDRARSALEYARGRTWQARTASVIRYGLLGATASTALAGSQKRVIASLAAGALVADQVARRLDADTPALAPWLAGLSDEPLVLNPGACGSRTVFAAPMRNARVVEVTIP
jgi:hypothetical protein